ncbi:hypothetical protein R84B8_03018 [Treponema sp. R8-4-B8]
MTITQTVEIPENRRVHLDFDVPREIPTGKAQVEFKVIPFVKKEEKPAILQTDTKTPHTDTLLSLLSNIGEVNIDEIRDERLARHLK